MNSFQIIALTPPGLLDPAVAVAASRAEGIGILDLGLIQEAPDLEDAFQKLKRYARSPCGVRLDSENDALISRIIPGLTERNGYIILFGVDPGRLSAHVRKLHDIGMTVLWESRSLDHARRGVEAGVDGLIAKGNEAGGWVGKDTTFILLQRILKETSLPVWAQGGIGLHTAAGCYAAGAAGVVMDTQLLLARESTIPESAKTLVAGMDGGESLCLGEELGMPCRLFARPKSSSLEELRNIASDLSRETRPENGAVNPWVRSVTAKIGWEGEGRDIWPVGQDIAWAKPLADRFRTVGGILEGIRRSVDAHLSMVRRQPPFSEGTPLAESHGTRYPIVQGPMARVSDGASFAYEVAKCGALPFLAVGYMGAASLEKLLQETRQVLKDLPWGVGILGFLPSDRRKEQLDVIRRFSPPFAIVAGARPEHVRPLEKEGIQTYVHVPSVGLLDMFLKAGARRFIFEGRECGGHVGPRSSFTLWESMIDAFLRGVPEKTLHECHVLFAGGIHDATSSAMVGATAAPLAEKGVRLGLLMGTAYLFTKEAVSTGAILEGYQKEALDCDDTMLLESSPGHAVRCTVSPYARRYQTEKQRLGKQKASPDEIRRILEDMNRGRLRIASKGVKRSDEKAHRGGETGLVKVDATDQRSEGLYMIGQLATLRDDTPTIKQLHEAVSAEGSRHLMETERSPVCPVSGLPTEKPSDVAIIGMACFMPKAGDLQRYWENIIHKVNAITEIPEDRWNWRRYFEEGTRRQDRFYSKWGGFLDPVPFDPMRYGMPPNSLKSVEPLQLLTLEAVRLALKDAGYGGDRPFSRERTSVIVGASGGLADLGQAYALRAALPAFLDDVPEEILSQLPEWTEDSFAGTLTNVAAGRVANRLDLGGVNYSINAACASSLAAVYTGVRELESGTSDMVLVAGSDTFQNPHFFFCFSKTHALSPTGRCRTFDKDADGTCISEGIAVVALKRLTDAERDGDRIYGVIKGVAGSSDGRHKGLTAPHPEGQARALNRAYAKSGFSPATVGLIEAHGTGTVAGDRSEIETLKQVFEAADAGKTDCALGSVKSITGHTKSAAGIAGLIKIALSLHHKVLPPTIGVTTPNPSLADSPFYVNTEVRPWFQNVGHHPRRAGVSSFGFGGTNFHAVVEEYTEDFLDPWREAVCSNWPSELFLFAGDSVESIIALAEKVRTAISKGSKPRMADLAYVLWRKASEEREFTLAIVAHSLGELAEKIAVAEDALKAANPITDDGRGIYYSPKPLIPSGKIAFVFPGQGSQHPDMLRELALHFPEVRNCFAEASQTLRGRFKKALTDYVFPPPSFAKEEDRRNQQELTQTHVTQPALSAAAMAVFRLMASLQVRPDLVAGHSSGEYAALCAAEVFGERDLYRLTEARGRFITEMTGDDSGTMAAVKAGRGEIEAVIKDVEGVWVANLNAPKQTIVSGTREAMADAAKRLEEKGMRVRSIPVSCAFHSPIVAPARDRLAEFIGTVDFSPPRFPVFSNTTGREYPESSGEISELLSRHLVNPVNFVDEIENMYEAGARVFVEVGPRNVLTGLVRQIVSDRPGLAVATDRRDRSGVLQLNHLLGQLAAEGVEMNLGRLYQGRVKTHLSLGSLMEEGAGVPFSQTTWMVTGGKVWPYGGERPGCPRPLGMGNRLGDAYGKPGEAGEIQSMTKEASGGTTAVERVMARHQELMAQFLETHKGVMKACLGQTTGETLSKMAESALEEVSDVSESAFPAGRVPEPGRQAETAVADGEGVEPGPADASPVAATVDDRRSVEGRGGIDEGELTRTLVRIVSERTGYPEDMIDLDLSLDADLGIDSIKWVEILGTLQQSYLHLDESQAQSAMEELSQLGTLRGVIEWFSTAEVAGENISHAPAESPDMSPKSESPVRLDRDALTRGLVGIVSERTGYPEDMIDLDLSLDAELGIDSIKWVEILGTFQESCLHLDDTAARSAMAELSEIGTLRGVIDWFENAGLAGQEAIENLVPSAEGREVSKAAGDNVACHDVRLPRYVLSTEELAFQGEKAPIPQDGVFLITDDGRGIAQELGEQLRNRGARVVVLQDGKKPKKKRKSIYTADLQSLSQMETLAGLVEKKEGPVVGIVHLIPLRVQRPLEEMETTEWRRGLAHETKSLFLLAKAFGGLLKRSGDTKAAWMIAATGMGGAFAIDGHMPRTLFPGHGGLCGLIKTLSLEWPQVRCRVVDLDPTDSIPRLADGIFQEILHAGKEVEAGVTNTRRVVPVLERKALDPVKAPNLDIQSDWVILLTGGARGITGRVTLEIARRYKPTILIAGRSPLPLDESPETADIDTVDELRRVLIDKHFEMKGQRPTPRLVEDDMRKLLQAREMRRTFQGLEEIGVPFKYYPADVRDEAAFTGVIEDIYDAYGRLDGIIHGAGIIDDKLVEDKTVDVFERVFHTKVDSAFFLSRKIQMDALKFLVFFSSIAGRFGNRGQSDYAAANEVLNKLAVYLNRKHSARVVAVNWNPWADVGMASPEALRQFEDQGIIPIDATEGCDSLDREIRFGDTGDTEIVIGEGPWKNIKSVDTGSVQPDFPLLDGAQVTVREDKSAEFFFPLDPRMDPYLKDHQIDGKSVFPFAVAMELMSEVAQRTLPGWSVSGIRSAKRFKGIVLDGERRQVRVWVTPAGSGDSGRNGFDVNVEIQDLSQPGSPFYTAIVELARTLPESPVYEHSPSSKLRPFPMGVQEAYEKWLFHGPCFQGIIRLEGFTENGLCAQLMPSMPSRCLDRETGTPWVIDPVVIDSAFQLSILWERAHYDMTFLISSVGSYRRFGPFPTQPIRCWAEMTATVGGHLLSTNFHFVDEKGKVMAMIENMEGSCSKELNRIVDNTD